MKAGILVIKIHRILGTVLSILFLMWFLSGMVMMYHSYPSVNDEQRVQHTGRILPSSVNDGSPWSFCDEGISSAMLERIGETSVWHITTEEKEYLTDASNGQEISGFNANQLQAVAANWSSSLPVLKDTLRNIDVWLIGAMPFKEYPIYHYSFDDGCGTELYVSSRTGKVLQMTDSSSRFWAWIGAIPHWIYITKLRAEGRQPWTSTVLWISGFGIVMVIAGIIVGIRSMYVARRRKGEKRGITPYAKPLFRWHHLTGLIFGLFVLTWIFSGYMSLADAPIIIWPVHDQHSARQIYANQLSPELFRLDCRKVLAADDVRRLSLMEMGGMPFYQVWTNKEHYLVDAADTVVKRVTLDEKKCRRIVDMIHHPVIIETVMMNEYDNYYVSQKHKLPLPVCRVSVDDDDKSVYYINPSDGSCRYYNTNKRAGKWMYSGLHALNIPFFVNHPVLRQVIMWALLLGGTIVSVTGLCLSFRYIRRMLSHKR